MKILHTSDWHLGKILHEYSLIEDQIFLLNKLVEFIKKNHHDILIIAGDIYDRSIPSREAVKAFSNFIVNLRKISDISVVIISGNHDSADRLAYLSDILVFKNIYLQTDVSFVDKPISIGNVDIYAIPFLDPYVFDFSSDIEDEKKDKKTHENAVKKVIEKIKNNLDKEKINVCVAHLFTRGAVSSDSERNFVGTTGEVDSTIFSCFDYTALGHLHRPQKVDENIYYSGSPLKYSFSESNDSKVILSIEIGKASVDINNVKIDSLYGLSRISGTLETLLSDSSFDKYKDDYLEVEIQDNLKFVNPLRELSKRYNRILSIRYKDRKKNGEDIEIGSRDDSDIFADFAAFQKFLYSSDNELFKEKNKLIQDYLNTKMEIK